MPLVVAALLLFMAWFAAEHFPPWISWHTEIWAFAAVMCAAGHLLLSRQWRAHGVKLPTAGMARCGARDRRCDAGCRRPDRLCRGRVGIPVLPGARRHRHGRGHAALQCSGAAHPDRGLLRSWPSLQSSYCWADLVRSPWLLRHSWSSGTMRAGSTACLGHAARGRISVRRTSWQPCCCSHWPALSFYSNREN